MFTEDASPEIMPEADSHDDAAALPAPSGTGGSNSQTALREEVRLPRRNIFWRILVFLFKLVLFVAVIAGLAAAVYYGWPLVHSRYILPVENNIAKVAVLEANQQTGQEQLVALQTQIPGLVALQAQQAATLTALAPLVDSLERSINERDQALAASQSEQAAALTALAPRIGKLEGSSKEQTQALLALENTQTGLQAGNTLRQAEIEKQLTLLKGMELLSRARLFLYQSNFGLAKQDVQAGRDLLAGLLASPDQQPDQDLAEVVQRLDMALTRLPDFPVAASGDLEIAWQILIGGQAQPVIATPTPEANENTPAAGLNATEPVMTTTPTPTEAGSEAAPSPTLQATGTVTTPGPTP